MASLAQQHAVADQKPRMYTFHAVLKGIAFGGGGLGAARQAAGERSTHASHSLRTLQASGSLASAANNRAQAGLLH